MCVRAGHFGQRVRSEWSPLHIHGTESLGAPLNHRRPTTTGDTRPATTTFFGDTGLWFVPTAEVLPHGRYSVSGYRANWDYMQGLTDVSHFAITGAGGIRERVEIFGSFLVDTRIDRDRSPIFGPTDPVWAAWSTTTRSSGTGVDRRQRRRPLRRREVQSDVRMAAAAGGDRGARDGEAADRRYGRRAPARARRIRAGFHRQQGVQPRASRWPGTAGVDLARRAGRPGRGRRVGWVPLGRRRRVPVAGAAAPHDANCTGSSGSATR